MDAFLTLLVLLSLGLVLASVAACIAKGKYGMALLGIVFHPAWPIGAIRLAKPNSFWARKYYDDAKRARSVERHADVAAQDGRRVLQLRLRARPRRAVSVPQVRRLVRRRALTRVTRSARPVADRSSPCYSERAPGPNRSAARHRRDDQDPRRHRRESAGRSGRTARCLARHGRPTGLASGGAAWHVLRGRHDADHIQAPDRICARRYRALSGRIVRICSGKWQIKSAARSLPRFPLVGPPCSG